MVATYFRDDKDFSITWRVRPDGSIIPLFLYGDDDVSIWALPWISFVAHPDGHVERFGTIFRYRLSQINLACLRVDLEN